jgi:RNase H-fold protein (predicted Holliday junction resolvase)
MCAIDPGREKFGVAVGTASELAYAAIVPRGEIESALECVASGDYSPLSAWTTEGVAADGLETGIIYLGNGTSHGEYAKLMDEKNILYTIIEERMTTLEARELYWRLHPPSGLLRLIPLSLCVPPRPIDDLAAWAIMKRAVKTMYSSDQDKRIN